MNGNLRTVLAALGYLLSLSSARADLTWDAREIRLAATPADEEVIARYRYRNDGTTTVKFKSFKSACDCVSISTKEMTVPPGAAGEIVVSFRPEFRLGMQKRPIAIQFDDAEQSRMALYLQVEIPEIVRPQPIFLKWGSDEQMSPKTVRILTDDSYAVESMVVRPLPPRWEAKVTPVEGSREYQLEVKPYRGPVPQARYVEVEAKFADGKVKRTNVYVVVR